MLKGLIYDSLSSLDWKYGDQKTYMYMRSQLFKLIEELYN